MSPALGNRLTALWHQLTPHERAALPQYPRLLQGMAELGLHEALVDAAEPLALLLHQPATLPVVRSLLRHARQTRQLALGARLLDAWAPHWRPGLAWSNEAVQLLVVLARHADRLDQLLALYRWAQPLHTALDTPGLSAELRTLLLRRLPIVASRTLDIEAMQRLCRAATQALDALDTLEDALAWMPMLNVLHHFDPLAPVEPLLQHLAARHPQDPRVQLLRARMLAESGGATAAQLLELIETLPPDGPGYHKAALWLARNLFYLDAQEEALRWYGRAAEGMPLTAFDARRVDHLSMKLTSEPSAALAASLETSRLRATDQDEPAPVLAELATLMNLDSTHDATPVVELEARMAHSLHGLAAALSDFEGGDARWALDIGRELCRVADSTYQRTGPFRNPVLAPMNPHYGMLDPQRRKTIFEGAGRHVVLIGFHVLERETDGVANISHLRPLIELVELLVDLLILLDEPTQALALVNKVQAKLKVHDGASGPAHTVLQCLAQHCKYSAELDFTGAQSKWLSDTTSQKGVAAYIDAPLSNDAPNNIGLRRSEQAIKSERQKHSAVGSDIEKPDPAETRNLLRHLLSPSLEKAFELVAYPMVKRSALLAQFVNTILTHDVLPSPPSWVEKTNSSPQNQLTTSRLVIPKRPPAAWKTDKRAGDTPPDFIKRHYGQWLREDGLGLSKADLRRLDFSLYAALANWLSRKNALPDDCPLPTLAQRTDRELETFDTHGVDAQEVARLAIAKKRRNR